jgi:hypothetical protein
VRQCFEFERAGLGHARVQTDAHHLAGGAALAGQRGLDFVQFLQLVGGPLVEQRADGVLTADGRAEEAETHRFADHQAEFLRR